MNRRIVLVIGVIGTVIVFFGLMGLIFRGCGGRRPLFGNKAEGLYNQAGSWAKQGRTAEAVRAYQKIVNEYPRSKRAVEAYFELAKIYDGQGLFLQAKDAYKLFIQRSTDTDSVKIAHDRLGHANIKILFSPIQTKDSRIYKVERGDTLDKISKKFNTTVNLIKKANNLKTDLIRPGMELKVSAAKFSAVVDKSQNTLSLKSNEEILKIYSVSTGNLEGPTPSGRFVIETKLVDPTWRGIPPGDPRNVLGSRWLGFAEPFKDYGIHGTTDPSTIGTQNTRGCIRMLEPDVQELFDILPLGTEVVIVD